MSFLGGGSAPKPTPTPPPPTINQATQNVDAQMDMLRRRGAAATLYAGPNAAPVAANQIATKSLLGS